MVTPGVAANEVVAMAVRTAVKRAIRIGDILGRLLGCCVVMQPCFEVVVMEWIGR